jgi:DNA-binding transcriptional LysR family regulator
MIRFTLRQLEYFEEAANCRSIAAASLKLNISQPSISSAIRKLEEQLGFDLLIRHHAQGVSLTRAGARFLKESRNLLRLGRDLQWESSTQAIGVSRSLSVGCFATLAPVFMPKLIAEFCRQHPSTSISLEEGTQADLVRLLRGGDIEIALLYDLELPEDIAVEHLARFAPQVLLPARHRFAKSDSVRLEWLAEEPFILLDIPPSREYFVGLFRTEGLKPRIRFSTHSLETVRGMVGQGLGYSVLVTRPLVDTTYDGERVVVRPIRNRVNTSAVSLARLQHVRPTRVALSFEKFCKEQLSDLPRKFPWSAPALARA